MNIESLLYVQGLFCGVLLLVCVACVAAFVADRLAPAASASTFGVAVLVAATWLLMGAFHVLAAVRLFRIEAAIPLWVAAGGASLFSLSRARETKDRLRRLFEDCRAGLAEVFRASPLLIPATGVLVVFRVLRGLAAPPMGWDMLTYHLVKVARWIRSGGLAPELAPDRWDGYEYFPYNGDTLWAWAMLPFRGDAPLALASALTWLAALAAAYALIRTLGGSRASAGLGAVALGLLPCSFNFIASGYVENVSLFLFLSGAVFTCRLLLRSAPPSEALLALGAFSAGAGVKASGLPVLILGVSAIAILALARSGAKFRSPRLVAWAFLAVAVGAPPYVRAWAERGSPLYPLPLRLAGRTVAEGHQETELAVAGKLYRGMDRFSWDGFADDFLHRRDDREMLNPGWGAFLLLLGGTLGALPMLGTRRTRAPAIFLLLCGAVVLLGLLTPDTLGLRTRWSWIIGRFLLPPLAVLAAFTAAPGGLLPGILLRASVAIGWYYGIPRGLSWEDGAATSRLAGTLLVAACLGVLIRIGSRRLRRPRLGAVLILALGIVAATVWGRIRSASRFEIYAAAADRRVFELHPFSKEYGSAWSLWKQLDESEPHHVAVCAGWNFLGDNWLIYPFFGSHLQNEVTWVSPTVDGSAIDYRFARRDMQRFDAAAWVTRLLDRRIDSVAVLWPRTVEENWIRALPELFDPRVVSGDGKNLLFSVRRDAARAWLARGAPLPKLVIDVPGEGPS